MRDCYQYQYLKLTQQSLNRFHVLCLLHLYRMYRSFHTHVSAHYFICFFFGFIDMLKLNNCLIEFNILFFLFCLFICLFYPILDAPNDTLYMICGVIIAMLLVGIIIILVAVTIR